MYSATQEVPEFYRQAASAAKQRTLREQEQLSSGLEQRLSSLRDAPLPTDLQNWEALVSGTRVGQGGAGESTASVMRMPVEETFTEVELNAWLATELKHRFSQVLPAGVSDPRVKISNGRVQAGFRYEQGSLQGIVNLDGDITMTDERNEVAVRIREINMGSLPLPADRVTAWVNEAGERSLRYTPSRKLSAPLSNPVRWTKQGGDPVALIRLTVLDILGIELTTLDLREGKIHLGGVRGRPL